MLSQTSLLVSSSDCFASDLTNSTNLQIVRRQCSLPFRLLSFILNCLSFQPIHNFGIFLSFICKTIYAWILSSGQSGLNGLHLLDFQFFCYGFYYCPMAPAICTDVKLASNIFANYASQYSVYVLLKLTSSTFDTGCNLKCQMYTFQLPQQL